MVENNSGGLQTENDNDALRTENNWLCALDGGLRRTARGYEERQLWASGGKAAAVGLRRKTIVIGMNDSGVLLKEKRQWWA